MADPTVPDLPEGYRWQFALRAENRDITEEYFASMDATEARIWHEGGACMVALVRDSAEERWRLDGSCPGLHDWETFGSVVDIVHRIELPV